MDAAFEMDKEEMNESYNDAPKTLPSPLIPQVKEVPVGILVDLSDDKKETKAGLPDDYDTWDPDYNYVNHRVWFHFLKYGLSAYSFSDPEKEEKDPTPQFFEETGSDSDSDTYTEEANVNGTMYWSPTPSDCTCYKCQLRTVKCCNSELKERIRMANLEPTEDLNYGANEEAMSTTTKYNHLPKKAPAQGSSKMMQSEADQDFLSVTGRSSSGEIAEGTENSGASSFEHIRKDTITSAFRRQQTLAWIIGQEEAAASAAVSPVLLPDEPDSLPSAFAVNGENGKLGLQLLRRSQ